MGQLLLVACLVGLRLLLRNREHWFWWVPGDVESWAFLEMVFLLALLIVFGVWFAATKIRLRIQLGRMAWVLGAAELLVGGLHIATLLGGIVVLAITVSGNPEIDEATIDAMFDAQAPLVVLGSGVSVCAVSLLTAVFFASVRGRNDPESSRP